MMAENSNVLRLDNNVSSSNGNELYITAESNILNVSNETSNVSFERLELESDELKRNCCGPSNDNLKNIEHPIDPNSNVCHSDIDLSISEKFARMKLQSEGNDSFVNEFKSIPFSEPKDKSFENQSGETPCRDVEDLPLFETCSNNTLEETMTSEVGTSLHENASSPLTKGGILHCPEINQSPCQDFSNNNLLGNTLPLLDDKVKDVQDSSDCSLLEMSTSSGESKILMQDVQSECLVDNISLNENRTGISLTPSFQEPNSISSETFNSSILSSSELKLTPGSKSVVDHGTPPSTESQDSSFFSSLPVKSAELIDSSHQEAKIDSCDVSEVPQDEDEMFTDAVQFFKDPSSFQFLENIQTSGPPESVIPRSSLYVAFDPLHSKILPVSSMQSMPVLPQRSETRVGAEVDPRKSNSVPVNKHLADVSVRESMGNILISFDSPMAAVKVHDSQIEDVPSVVPKHYTEEELQQALKVYELSLQEMYLRQHRELEQEIAKIKEEGKEKIEKLSLLCRTQHCTIEELAGITSDVSESKREMQEKIDIMEKENEKLKEDLKTAGEDLQSVESMFSDFHKRYEQCKGMLKTYKDNEVHLREGVQIWKTKLIEQEQKYDALQERTQEILEKANAEVASAKKSSDGQVTVLKAQLKKAELKISGLESDIKQIKMENNQLGGLCDDLMAQVKES